MSHISLHSNSIEYREVVDLKAGQWTVEEDPPNICDISCVCVYNNLGMSGSTNRGWSDGQDLGEVNLFYVQNVFQRWRSKIMQSPETPSLTRSIHSSWRRLSEMPADIDVLVAGSSPITFSPSYLSYSPNRPEFDEPCDVLTSKSLDLATVLSNGTKSSHYLSCSPPVIGSSPPTHFTFHGRCSSPTLRTVPPPAVTLAKNLTQLRLPSNDDPMPVAVPRRPCLVVRCDVLDLPSPNKHKKRVVFADDRGFPLTLVRTMTEPSSMPPRWSFQFLAQVTQGASVDVADAEPWEIDFPQPASDYLYFRRRLDTNNVSLENVILKESEQAVVGTVKVRNLAFQKEVFVRTSSDDWATQEDAHCTYVPNIPSAHGVTVLYDTFSFRLTLPPRSRKLQFCVCFRCSGSEYWDNNFGKNYFIVKKEFPNKPRNIGAESATKERKTPDETKINLSRRFRDDVIPNAQVDSWSEFASWNHLTNNTPYW